MVSFEVPSEWVSPGWFPLILVAIIAFTSVGLYFSMRHHLRVARRNDPALAGGAPSAGSPMEEPGGE